MALTTTTSVPLHGIACPTCQMGEPRWEDDGIIRCAACKRPVSPPLHVAVLWVVSR